MRKGERFEFFYENRDETGGDTENMSIRSSPINPTTACLGASAVDLFCGAGGLTHGLLTAGIRVNAGVDVDAACRYPYERNNDCFFVEKDVSELSGDELSAYYPQDDVKILVGCAPCQPFSRYSRGKTAADDEKWGLVRSFGRIVEEMRPEIVSMENVPELRDHPVYGEFLATLEAAGYSCSHSVVHCPRYGVAQSRKRLVLFASRLGALEMIPPTHDPETLSVQSVIGEMEGIVAGGASEVDALHRSSRLSDLNLQRIRVSTPGGTWRDWDEELRTLCHRGEKGRTFPSVYGRMEWEGLAPTITTQFFGYGNGRFGHPEQDRAISLREGAMLQSFPRTYEFVEPGEKVGFTAIGRLIGNAVPVRLGECVGESIRGRVENWRATHMLPGGSDGVGGEAP